MRFRSFLAISLSLIIIASCSKDSGGNANQAQSTGKGGSLSKFTIVGNYLYAVSNHSLYAFDISTDNPVQTNSSELLFDLETIYSFKDKLFLGSRTGLYIYSIADPAHPALIGEASHARACDPVVANDSMAFVTLKGSSNCGPAVSGLYVEDIRNISQPVTITTVAIPSPEGLGLNGHILYVCCNADGLKVYDVQNPSHPIELRTINDGYYKDVIAYDDLLVCYVNNGLLLYDISNPVLPVLKKAINN